MGKIAGDPHRAGIECATISPKSVPPTFLPLPSLVFCLCLSSAQKVLSAEMEGTVLLFAGKNFYLYIFTSLAMHKQKKFLVLVLSWSIVVCNVFSFSNAHYVRTRVASHIYTYIKGCHIWSCTHTKAYKNVCVCGIQNYTKGMCLCVCHFAIFVFAHIYTCMYARICYAYIFWKINIKPPFVALNKKPSNFLLLYLYITYICVCDRFELFMNVC